MTQNAPDDERAQSQQLSNHLMVALGSRDVSAITKGMLMKREGVTEEETFQMLVTAAQQKNMKLREIARQLVEEREERSRARDR